MQKGYYSQYIFFVSNKIFFNFFIYIINTYIKSHNITNPNILEFSLFLPFFTKKIKTLSY